MSGYRRMNVGVLAHASEQGMPLESRVSNQKLVRDEVVFTQVRDRDAELSDAIRRLHSTKNRVAERVEHTDPEPA